MALHGPIGQNSYWERVREQMRSDIAEVVRAEIAKIPDTLSTTSSHTEPLNEFRENLAQLSWEFQRHEDEVRHLLRVGLKLTEANKPNPQMELTSGMLSQKQALAVNSHAGADQALCSTETTVFEQLAAQAMDEINPSKDMALDEQQQMHKELHAEVLLCNTRPSENGLQPQEEAIRNNTVAEKLRNLYDTINTINAESENLVRTSRASRRIAESPTFRDRIQAFVHSTTFMAFSATLVVTNGLFVAWQTQKDLQFKHSLYQEGDPARDFSYAPEVELLFIIIFTLEIIVRILGDRLAFCFGIEWRWNMFDAFLIMSSLLEVLIKNNNLSFARLLRVLRMIRGLRIVRALRFFLSLRKMIYSIMNCLLALFWLTVLICLVIFVFATCFMQATANYIDISADGKCVQDLTDKYGTLWDSMLTLFMSITGGLDWHEASRPIFCTSTVYGIFFLLYIFFVTFGVLNVVTGVFVDKALEIAQLDQDMAIMDQVEQQKKDMKNLRQFLEDIDDNCDGVITKEEIMGHITGDSELIQAALQTMHIDGASLDQLFDILDPEQTGHVLIEEFVQGCLRVRGDAKSIDMCRLLVESRLMHGKLKRCLNRLEQQM